MMKISILENMIQTPLIKLVYSFMEALQKEDFELCGKIKLEMDRRNKIYGINKKSLNDILDSIEDLLIDVKSENKEYFDTFFKKYI